MNQNCNLLFLQKLNEAIDNTNLQIKNDKGQTLLHILCNNKSNIENNELVSKIYDILILVSRFNGDLHGHKLFQNDADCSLNPDFIINSIKTKIP